jgi:monothiol glutaredoxin
LTRGEPYANKVRAASRGEAGEAVERHMSDVKKTIQETVEGNRVVLFMKGTKNFPQCGFSARAVDILKKCGTDFKDVNVLADPGIRQGIKDFSSWPTVPQIYIGGKFVGGSDILAEMFESGELQKLLAS